MSCGMMLWALLPQCSARRSWGRLAVSESCLDAHAFNVYIPECMTSVKVVYLVLDICVIDLGN